MVKPIKFDESGDSADLQALFDDIASADSAPPPPPPEPDPSGDSSDLQALFDSLAEDVTTSATTAESVPAAAAAVGAPSAAIAKSSDPAVQEEVFNRIGHLVRSLHDSLRELGYDQSFEEAARGIPDVQERLAYIANMTEKAASRVLNAADIAQPVQEQMATDTQALGQRWQQMFANQLSVEEFKKLAADSRDYFAAAPDKINQTNAQLSEIVLAQDFQDLTGQVIKRVVDTLQKFETQLVQWLIEAMPEEKKAARANSLMNGPVINADGKTEVVTNQQQVDDLLDSLGF